MGTSHRRMPALALGIAALSLVIAPAANASTPDGPWTQDQVTSVATDIMASNKSPVISVWYVDEGGTAHVGLPSLDPALMKELTDRLGPKTEIFQRELAEPTVKVVPRGGLASELYMAALTSPRSQRALLVLSRTSDQSPWKAGDRITRSVSGSNVLCTSGGRVNNLGATAYYMALAGHCGPTGSSWSQGGNQFTTQWGNNRIDGALMNGLTYSAEIWASGTTRITTSGTVSDSTYSGVPAISLCLSGATTGWTCGGSNGSKITTNGSATTECVTYTGGTYVCNLREASNSSVVIVQGGDSGGPVVRPLSNGTYQWAGVISGSGNGGHRVYYAPAAQFLSIFGVYKP